MRRLSGIILGLGLAVTTAESAFAETYDETIHRIKDTAYDVGTKVVVEHLKAQDCKLDVFAQSDADKSNDDLMQAVAQELQLERPLDQDTYAYLEDMLKKVSQDMANNGIISVDETAKVIELLVGCE